MFLIWSSLIPENTVICKKYRTVLSKWGFFSKTSTKLEKIIVQLGVEDCMRRSTKAWLKWLKKLSKRRKKREKKRRKKSLLCKCESASCWLSAPFFNAVPSSACFLLLQWTKQLATQVVGPHANF